jgi:beta-fructofuranosidase
MGILYGPSDGVAADFIPFYWEGAYHLFYLKDYRDTEGHGEGTPWWHLMTHDFVHFEDWGEALPRGATGSQDVWVFTGSAMRGPDAFHIFYTGHNGHFYNTPKPVQGVLHATSPDLRTWRKDPGLFFLASTDRYEKDDWRDPFVFWNEEAQEYWMLLAARKKEGPSRNRGCTALAASKDLVHWEVRPAFWAPDEYYTHECPDLFRLGDWWYLVYSTFSERSVTHHRMSRSLQGPWLAPANDTFDGRAYYAAKTAADEAGRRYVFGWVPTREGEKDDGNWQWGGNLVAHEVVQQPDGALTVRMPDTVRSAFQQSVPLAPKPILGNWCTDFDTAYASAMGRFSTLSLGELPQECLLEVTITYQPGTYACGLFLRADAAFDGYYTVRLEPANQRLVIDRWPRPGDQPFMLERPVPMQANQPIRLRIIVDGTCLVVYVDDRVALCCRMYDHRAGNWGLFATEGQVHWKDLACKVRA